MGCRNILPANVDHWKFMLGCSGHGASNPKQSGQCLWAGASALWDGVHQGHGEKVMVMMVTWLCCLGLGCSASASPNHAVGRAEPSQSLQTAPRS